MSTPPGFQRPHRHRPALFSAFPALASRVAFTPLVEAPTPIAPLQAVSAAAGCEVWIKRDDRTHPLQGGNKVRKLEFLLGAAVAAGRRSVLTIGARGSNHVLATAFHARSLNLHVGAVTYPRPASESSHLVEEASRRAGAEILDGPYALLPISCGRLLLGLTRAHGRPYIISAGGSSPLGCLGYVDAGLELAAQVAAGELPAPDDVFVPLGSGGTVAGVLLGLRLGGLATRLWAVRVVPWAVSSRPWLMGLASATRTLLVARGAPRRFGSGTRVPLRIEARQLGEGYGYETAAGRDAVALAARDGITLETTYSGKTLAGLLALAGEGQLGRRVLFWDTYGPPSPPP